MPAHSWILVAERLPAVEHGDLGAEPVEGLGERKRDPAAAQHDQMLRPLACLERVLVGEIGHLFEARDRRNQRPRAGRDDKAARLDLVADVQLGPDDNGFWVAKACLALDHAHAEAGQALLGLVRRDRIDDAMDVIVDLGEFDGGRGGGHAERRGTAKGSGAVGGSDHRLRRYAAGMKVLAAQPALLDQHHRHAERGGCRRQRQAGGARADDAEIRGQKLSQGVPRPPNMRSL